MATATSAAAAAAAGPVALSPEDEKVLIKELNNLPTFSITTKMWKTGSFPSPSTLESQPDSLSNGYSLCSQLQSRPTTASAY